MSDHPNEHHEKHVFFYGPHRLHAPHERVKVHELKEITAKHVEGFNREHTLVFEEHGDRPDKPLSNGDEVHIHEFPHYYDQPPATFGC